MIIHRYIKRVNKDKGLIDASETEYCCPEMQTDVKANSLRIIYDGVFAVAPNYMIQLKECGYCQDKIKYKNHYVGEDTLWKHVGSAFKGKVFV